MIFGSYDTNTNGLILTSVKIGVPAIKKYEIDVPGSNGKLDFSGFFGDIKYENRELEFEFVRDHSDVTEEMSSVTTALHGKKVDIITDQDQDHIYKGRLHVKEWDYVSKRTTKILISCDCEPYKYKIANTVVNKTLESTPLSVTLVNSRMPVIPTLTTSGSIQITYGTKVLNFSAGTYKATDLLLLEGNNDMTISGPSGTTVKFEYLEGVL